MLRARMTARRLPLLLACVALAMGLSACNKHKVLTEASTEGPFINVGPLDYQVQISRQLNPADPEDHAYLAGLPGGTAMQPPKGQVWFAVFMRVQNVTKQTQTPTTQFVIRDTQGQEYRPIPLDPKVNPFAYVATPLGPGDVNPNPESIAANGPVQQGSLLLFKLKTASLQNRPLMLIMQDGAGHEATVALDL